MSRPLAHGIRKKNGYDYNRQVWTKLVGEGARRWGGREFVQQEHKCEEGRERKERKRNQRHPHHCGRDTNVGWSALRTVQEGARREVRTYVVQASVLDHFQPHRLPLPLFRRPPLDPHVPIRRPRETPGERSQYLQARSKVGLKQEGGMDAHLLARLGGPDVDGWDHARFARY